MNKSQLKQLINEVIREIESTDAPDFTKNSVAANKKAEEFTIKITASGAKAGGAFKKLLAKLTANAIAADYAVLRADIEKSGIKVANMNHEDLSNVAKSVGKPELAPQGEEDDRGDVSGDETNIQNVPKGAWKNMSPEKRDKYIKAGSHAAEWEKAGEKDIEDKKKAVEKARLKAAKIKAGTYDPDDKSLWTDKEIAAGEPDPTANWTDKDWDAFNSGEDVRTAQSPTGKATYRPRFGTKQVDPKLIKKGAVAGNFSDTLRH